MLNDLFIIDAHEDIAYHLSYFNRDFVNPSIPCMITLPWLKQGNVRLVFNTIFVPAEFKPHKTLEIALHQLSIYDRIYDEHNDDIFQVKNTGDLFRLQNDLRITLDLSHLNEKCFWEAIELCETIPIASHSNARSLTNHPRNLEDDQLRAISERGGVIGLVLYNHFLKTNCENPTCGEENRTTLEDVFAHADYIINLCGEDHVGIGSDLDGADVNDFPQEIRTVADLPKIAEYFLKKGYSEERVRKIMGGNFLRVLKENL